MSEKQFPFDEIEFYYEKFPKYADTLIPSHREKQELLYTNIKIIDNIIDGLLPTDLLLVGASTGLGKTQLALNIAKNVAVQGKQTIMFSLESYNGEIQDRHIFSEISKSWYAITNKYLSFKKWATGHADENIYKMEEEVLKNMPEALKENLRIRYRNTSTYSANKLCEELKILSKNQKIKLLVIDHLHYFTIEDKDTENIGLKKIMFAVRDIGQKLKIPIILIAHLRKKDIKSKVLVPDENEFHGSSEIVKNATSVITIAPADLQTEKNYIVPTYFRFPKLRFDEGGKKRYLYCVPFNLRSGEYDDTYRVFAPKNYWTAYDEVVDNNLPSWATHAKKIGEYESKFRSCENLLSKP